MGRTQKAFKNVLTGIMNKLILMLLAFAIRTLFVRLLGAEYTGINSLYTNILSVLSLAELGLGNVMMFYLYSALKDKNTEEICALVYEFKKIYNAIIICVLVVGLSIVPALQIIVNSELDHEELIVYYLLYLANSVMSYFVIYRTVVIKADQQEYILNNVATVMTVVMYVCQLGYLAIYRNFLGYLIIQVICTILTNMIQNYIAIKKYPYLKNKCKKQAKIDRKDLFKNVKATFLYKVSDTILDQTDNIIISIMFGTWMVGMYSNYYLIVTYLVNIAGIIANGVVASFGNLYVEGNKEKSCSMFKCSFLFFSIYAIVCTTCYICLIQDFVPIWVGKQFLMDYKIVLGVMMVFYLRMVTNTVWIYRSTMGVFKEVQYINIAAAGMNIVLSIILGKRLGVAGVIAATAISRLLTSFWYEGKVVINKLEVVVSKYFYYQLKSITITSITVVISLMICSNVKLAGMVLILVKLLIAVGISAVTIFLAYYKTEEFNLIVSKIRKKHSL